MNILRDDLKCISQIAMLGIVTGNLRAVTITVLAKELLLNFYYENSPSDEEIQLSNAATKKISSSFSKIVVREQQILLPQPLSIPLTKNDLWIYHRYEGNPPLFKVKTLFNDVTSTSVRCASQFALLGAIPRNLRAVSVAFFGRNITMDFYYEKKIVENLRIVGEWGLPGSSLLNVIHSFEDVTGEVRRFEISESENIPLQEGGFWVYMRHEKESS